MPLSGTAYLACFNTSNILKDEVMDTMMNVHLGSEKKIKNKNQTVICKCEQEFPHFNAYKCPKETERRKPHNCFMVSLITK